MTHHLHPNLKLILAWHACCISTQLPHTLKDGSHNLPATIRTEYTASPELTTHPVSAFTSALVTSVRRPTCIMDGASTTCGARCFRKPSHRIQFLTESDMTSPSTAWNLTLPLDQEHVFLEAQRSLARVCGGLAVSVATGNVVRGVPSFVRAVRDYLRLRHDATSDELSNVCKVLFEACTMVDIDLPTQTRCAVVLTKALKRLRKTVGKYDGALFSFMLESLSISKLLAPITSLHRPCSRQHVFIGDDVLSKHAKAWGNLISIARHFFLPGRTVDLINEIEPLFSSALGSHQIFGVQLLRLFAHFSGNEDDSDADDDIARTISFAALHWPRILNCDAWNGCWLSILSRAIKYCSKKHLPQLECFLPAITECFMNHASLKKDGESDAKCTTIPGVNQSLDTASGKSVNIISCSIKAVFRLAARTGSQSKACSSLRRLIQYCEPFARQNDVPANIVNVYTTLVKCIARAAPLDLLEQAAPLSERMHIPEAEASFIHSIIDSIAPSIVPVALASNQNAFVLIHYLAVISPKSVLPELFRISAKIYGSPAYQSQQSDVLHAVRGAIPALLLCNRSCIDVGVDAGQCISFIYSVCVQAMSSGNHSLISAGILLVVSLVSHLPLNQDKCCAVPGVPDPSEFVHAFVGNFIDFLSNLPSLSGHIMSYFESYVGRPVSRLAIVLFSDISPETLDAAVAPVFQSLHGATPSSTAALIFGRFLSGAVMVSHAVLNRLLKLVAVKLDIQEEPGSGLLTHPVVTCPASEATAWITVLYGALEHSGAAALSFFPDIERIIVASLRSAEKKVFKAGAVMLSKLLRALSSVYPINYGPYAGAETLSNVPIGERQLSGERWYIPADAAMISCRNLMIKFLKHAEVLLSMVPDARVALASYRSRSEALIDESQDETPSSPGVVQFPLTRTQSDVLPAALLHRIDSSPASVPSTLTESELSIRALGIVKAVVEGGVYVILPDVDDGARSETQSPSPDDPEVLAEMIDIGTAEDFSLYGMVSTFPSSFSALSARRPSPHTVRRSALVLLCSILDSASAGSSGSNVKLMKKGVNVAASLLSSRGESWSDINAEIGSYKSVKGMFHHPLLGVTTPNYIVMLRSLQHLRCRSSMGTHACTGTCEKIIDLVSSARMNTFVTVASAANSAFKKIGIRFPRHRSLANRKLIRDCQGEDSAIAQDETLAARFCSAIQECMGSLRTWGDISMVATSLIVISSARPETSVQLACNTVMNSLFKSFQPPPLLWATRLSAHLSDGASSLLLSRNISDSPVIGSRRSIASAPDSVTVPFSLEVCKELLMDDAVEGAAGESRHILRRVGAAQSKCLPDLIRSFTVRAASPSSSWRISLYCSYFLTLAIGASGFGDVSRDCLLLFADRCLSDVPALRRVSRYMISSLSRRLKLSSAVDSRTITPSYYFTKAMKTTADHEHLPPLRSPMLGPATSPRVGSSAFIPRLGPAAIIVSAQKDLSVAVEQSFDVASGKDSKNMLKLLSHIARDLQVHDDNDAPAAGENMGVDELEKMVGVQGPNTMQKCTHHFLRLRQMREIPDFVQFVKSLVLVSPKAMSASLLSVSQLLLDNPALAVGAQENEIRATVFACACALLRAFGRINLVMELAPTSAKAFSSIFVLLGSIRSLPESKRFCDMLSFLLKDSDDCTLQRHFMRRLCGVVSGLSSTVSFHEKEQWIRVCCAAVLYCPSHLLVPSIIGRLFMYAIRCSCSGAVILQQKSCKLISLLIRSSRFSYPRLHLQLSHVICHHVGKMRSAAFAWTQRSEEVIPDGRLTDGIHGMLMLFKRMLKRREMHFIHGATAPLAALSLLSLRCKPELSTLGYVCGTLIAHGMLFSSLPTCEAAGFGATPSLNDSNVSVDIASFLRMLMSPSGLDSRNWKCRRISIGMLMALLHKLYPAIDEPILVEAPSVEGHKLSALDALIFAMTDPVVDVRQRAFSVLAGCMRIASPAFVQTLASRLPSPVTSKKKSSIVDSAVIFTSHRGGVVGATLRHANVLCACAIVTAMPYTSPSQHWFADLIFKLCLLSDEGGAVGPSVRSTISQYRKVHNDTWDDLRFLFTEEVWESINSSTTSHSYFA